MSRIKCQVVNGAKQIKHTHNMTSLLIIGWVFLLASWLPSRIVSWKGKMILNGIALLIFIANLVILWQKHQ